MFMADSIASVFKVSVFGMYRFNNAQENRTVHIR